MPEQHDELTPELLLQTAKEMQVEEVTLGFTARRSVKIGDMGFTTYEAREEWKIRHPSGPVSAQEAQIASAYFAPKLIAKVFYGLFAGGVISSQEMRDRVKEASRLYSKITEPQNEPGKSVNDISGTGATPGTTSERSSDGIVVPEGTDDSVPSPPGPVQQSPGGGEPGIRSDSASSPHPESPIGSDG